MEEILVKVFKINNKEYYVVNELDLKNKHYVCLVNKKDNEDIMVRIVHDDLLVPLENEKELEEVLKLIIK